jgi:hypothetical protein
MVQHPNQQNAVKGMGDLQTLLPDFAGTANKLHSLLLGVCLVLAFAGLVRELWLTYNRGSLSALPSYLVKIFIAFVALGLLPHWSVYLGEMVKDLKDQIGVNKGNVLAAYAAALSTKFGVVLNTTGTPALNQNALDAQNNPRTGFQNGSSAPGVKISHYGYPGDSTPDTNSTNGIGNHNNQLVAEQSLAFSPDLIAEYHLQVGQTVTVTLANGEVLTGRFDDTTAAWLTGRVDVYDPSNSITFDGASVASIDGTTPVAGFDTGVAASPLTLFTAAAKGMDGLAAFLLGAFVLVLCVIGMFLMWLLSLLQQFLIITAIAVSPIFFGLLLIRGLDGIASRFLTGFVALCLWPLGWGIANLVTSLLLDFALNTSNNGALGVVNYLSGGVLWWLGLGLWTIGSSLFAPWMISHSIAAAHPGIATLLGETRAPAMALTQYSMRLGGGFAGSLSDGKVGGSGQAFEGGSTADTVPLTTLTRIRRFARRPGQ